MVVTTIRKYLGQSALWVLCILVSAAGCGDEGNGDATTSGDEATAQPQSPRSSQGDGSEGSDDAVSGANPDADTVPEAGAEAAPAPDSQAEAAGAGAPAPAEEGAAEADGLTPPDATVDPETQQAAEQEAQTAVEESKPAYFRLTELSLRDPHLFILELDITDKRTAGVSVNGLLHDGLHKDEDGDGNIDVAIVATLHPELWEQGVGTIDWVDGQCPFSDPNRCRVHPEPDIQTSWDVMARMDGDCSLVAEGSLSNYEPSLVIPQAPCFIATHDQDVSISLVDVRVDMTHVRLSARFDPDNPTVIEDGLLAGFVERTAAALLPPELALLFAPSIQSMVLQEDLDQASSPSGADGFWLYLNFKAEVATLE